MARRNWPRSVILTVLMAVILVVVVAVPAIGLWALFLLFARPAPSSTSPGPGGTGEAAATPVGYSPEAAMASRMASTRRASSTWRFSIIRPSTVTTPRPSASASSKAAMIRSASSISSASGEKAPLHGSDLARVDQRLAVHAHLPADLALGQEAGLVLDVVVDAVEDHLVGGPGRQQAQLQAAQQRQPARDPLGVQLLGQVVGAHHQDGQPLGRRADLLGVQHGDRRLEHGPDAGAVAGAVPLEGGLDGPDVGRPS